MSTTKLIRNFIVFFCILTFSTKANAQISTSFYTNDSYSKFAVGYNFTEKLWGDLRIYSGTSIDNITPEMVLNYNFIIKNSYDFYSGVGITLNNINGVVIPVGVAIKPFENLKELSFNIEFNPLYEVDDRNLFIRGFLGIRYRLK